VTTLVLERNNRVRELREARGWTQRELAERLGFSTSAVCGLENPSRSLRLPTLRKVSKALGVAVRDLLPGESAVMLPIVVEKEDETS